jgi:methionine sulfoxide reductase heme-binding subunit
MNDIKFNKILISFNALIPLFIFAIDFIRGNVGTNPIEFLIRTTGVLPLIFLLITLSITPLRKIFGWNGLIQYRRRLGVIAFLYSLSHLLSYFIFDKSSYVIDVLRDIVQRPFILVGMLAFILMIPLAITSTNSMVKKIGGKRWAKLHKLTYIVPILGVLHYYMLVKSDIFYPVLFGGILMILLLYRLYDGFNKRVISQRLEG